MSDIPELLPIADLKFLEACGIRWEPVPELWLFIQIDKDLRGFYWSLHDSEQKMLRDALRMEVYPFTVRKAGTWDSTPTAAQDRARDLLDEERRKAGYTGNAYDRVALKDWLIETGRLPADWDDVWDREQVELWAEMDETFLRSMGIAPWRHPSVTDNPMGTLRDLGEQTVESFQKLSPAQQEQTRKAMYESVTKKPYREKP